MYLLYSAWVGFLNYDIVNHLHLKCCAALEAGAKSNTAGASLTDRLVQQLKTSAN